MIRREPYKRCHPIRDPEGRKRWAAAQVQRCQVCLGRGDWRGLAVHHICRFRRSDESCNFLYVCGICHGMTHDDPDPQDGRLTMGMMVMCKWFDAPDDFCLPRLIELQGGPVDLEEPPAWLMAKWRQL